MYDVTSPEAGRFICHDEIMTALALARAEAGDAWRVQALLDKAAGYHGLTHREAAVLLQVEAPAALEAMYALARTIKEHIYGRRIVMFAPLYLSDYCVNRCSYCGYSCANPMPRRKLTQPEVAAEVRVLESMGHKRLALETGEDPRHCPIDYVLESHPDHLRAQIRQWRHPPRQRQHRRHHAGALPPAQRRRHRHLHPLPGNLPPADLPAGASRRPEARLCLAY